MLTGGAPPVLTGRSSCFGKSGLGRADRSCSASDADDLDLCGSLLSSGCLSDDDVRLMVLLGPVGEK